MAHTPSNHHHRRHAGRKKSRINPFLITYVIALVGLAAVGYYVAHYEIHNDRQHQEKYFATDLAYYDLPRISLTLASIGSSTASGKVRMDISLEVNEKDLDKLQDFQPRIMDTIINHMRQYDADDVKPSNVSSQLHENLLNVVNQASKPILIHNIVFRQFLVQ